MLAPQSRGIASVHTLRLLAAGITRVPVGDQPKNIEAQIKDLICGYIEGGCSSAAEPQELPK